MIRRMLLALFLLAASLLSPLLGGPAARAQPANMLQNPGFEGGFRAWTGIGEVYVAHSWTPWWRPHKEADSDAYYHRPEYTQANGYIFPNRVHGGAYAQQWFTFYRTHQAGMYQQVFGVVPGQRYRFTIWAQVWSSSEDNADRSQDPAYPNLQVGIDPSGDWNPWAATVVWSLTYAPYDRWQQLAIEAVAQKDVITVFVRSEPNFPVKHNDMYWDDAVLVAVNAAAPPAPLPQATDTPLASPVASPEPTATCSPPPADWVTYRVQRGDTLFSLARRSGTTVETIMSANCLDSTDIIAGQPLALPRQPDTPTPVPATRTPVQDTPTPSGETGTPTPTMSPAPTRTPTRTPSPTSTGTASATPSTTPTGTPTNTPTGTPTKTATVTPTRPTATPTRPTSTPTRPTATLTEAATETPTEAPPTIRPPATSTPGSPAPPATSAPAGGSTRPCGTIYVGAGIVVLAGVSRVRRRKNDTR
jgi:LysM repeat protein